MLMGLIGDKKPTWYHGPTTKVIFLKVARFLALDYSGRLEQFQ